MFSKSIPVLLFLFSSHFLAWPDCSPDSLDSNVHCGLIQPKTQLVHPICICPGLEYSKSGKTSEVSFTKLVRTWTEVRKRLISMILNGYQYWTDTIMG